MRPTLMNSWMMCLRMCTTFMWSFRFGGCSSRKWAILNEHFDSLGYNIWWALIFGVPGITGSIWCTCNGAADNKSKPCSLWGSTLCAMFFLQESHEVGRLSWTNNPWKIKVRKQFLCELGVIRNMLQSLLLWVIRNWCWSCKQLWTKQLHNKENHSTVMKIQELLSTHRFGITSYCLYISESSLQREQQRSKM